MGHRFDFRMRGVDRAGNTESYPGSAEAETYINFCSGDAYEADKGPAQATPIAPGKSHPHNLCGVNDEDWVKFLAQAGHRYVLQTDNLGFSADTVLTLYASGGATVLAENDDISYPKNLASRVARDKRTSTTAAPTSVTSIYPNAQLPPTGCRPYRPGPVDPIAGHALVRFAIRKAMC